ncbi:CRISPR-associated protein Cas1 [Methanomicrobium sp. W14]|uniref:CRISPR-associated endonuclease Cas1 n=1 Tax=Methanomicrobium sp. W14 TaxID=2817839 RepID=UPI001AE72786|nr:CRISPR-associated endonuclease Cas1 [Methanomicrobium sp. W14]MBP2132410.1 CRISPR-associated protein Cas1 [Methanomicrobium sp. W14]
MDLVINGYGAVLMKKSNRFVVECNGEKEEISTEDVDQIVICDSAVVSTAALACASERGIDLVVMKKSGLPECRVIPADFGKIARIRRCQLLASESENGFLIMRSIISAKIVNMSNLILTLSKTRDNVKLRRQKLKLDSFAAKAEKISFEDGYNALRGAEGAASSLYFSVLGEVIPKTFYSGKRSQHPAADIFNSYLNYCYGVLYNEVERACIYSGLDPWTGFMHADRSKNKSFIYDCVEQFRQPVADRLIITMAVRNRFSAGDVDNSFFLTNIGRRKAIGEIIARLDDERTILGKKTTFRKVIRENIRLLAGCLAEGTEYVPFTYKWN